MKLIDKAAVVAEIERRIKIHHDYGHYNAEQEFTKVLSFLDTLEVKEVDETEQRMKECPYRQVGCTMYKDKILECNGACGWVVDHQKLKELKAQEGK